MKNTFLYKKLSAMLFKKEQNSGTPWKMPHLFLKNFANIKL